MSLFFTRSHGSHATAAQFFCFFLSIFQHLLHEFDKKKSQIRCSRGSSKLCFKENPCLLKLSDLPGSNPTENRPLLCFCSTFKLHEATYPHLNPHTAVQDVYLHFRTNEWLQCKRATHDINIQISISGVNFRSLSPDLWFRLERMHKNKQFKSNIPVKIIKSWGYLQLMVSCASVLVQLQLFSPLHVILYTLTCTQSSKHC